MWKVFIKYVWAGLQSVSEPPCSLIAPQLFVAVVDTQGTCANSEAGAFRQMQLLLDLLSIVSKLLTAISRKLH
jgi:hypothetical protein